VTESNAEVALMTETADAALLQGLREAPAEAAGQFYDRFADSLLSFALACFPTDRQLAEDIVVQTFANAMRHLRRYDPRRASLLTWLYAIARRQVRDELRLRARRKSVPPSAQTPLEDAAGPAAGRDVSSQVAAQVDAQRFLVRLADDLSRVEFEVLILHSLHELSAKEIGRAIGRSERAVHSLLHRAKTKARERLAHDEQ